MKTIQFRKKIFLISLALGCLLPSESQATLNVGTKIAIGIGGSFLAGIIGTSLYKFLRTPSHSEEICTTKKILDEADSLHLRYRIQYENELNLLGLPELLKEEIQKTSYIGLVFLNFRWNLDESITQIETTIKNIDLAQDRIFKRQLHLEQEKPSTPIDEDEKIYYIQQFDVLIKKLKQQKNALLDLCNNLKRLVRFVVSLKEYADEYIFFRINNLEAKVEALASRLDYVPYCQYHPHILAMPAWCVENRLDRLNEDINNLDRKTDEALYYNQSSNETF